MRAITNVLFGNSLFKTVHVSSDRDIYDLEISNTEVDADIQYFQFRYSTEIRKKNFGTKF